MSYTIRWGGPGDVEDVAIAFAGVVSVEELIAAFSELRASPRFRTSMRMLHDHRLTDWSATTSSDIRRRAEAVARFEDPNERHRVAVVVDEKLPYGLMRMRQAYSEEHLASVDGVFYDLESARAWLSEAEP